MKLNLNYPRIIAHRCGGALAAENSLAGLAVAARLGCRGVEFDTMLSADGVPVLMHDETVDRTTLGSGVVSRLTLAELRQIDLDGEPVPTLAEALAECARLGLWANIELKPPAGGGAELGRVAGQMLARLWNGHGVVSSFATEALAASRHVAPHLPYALLMGEVADDWQDRCRQLGVVGLHADAARLSDSMPAVVHAAGLALAGYTVNRRSEGDHWLAQGVAVFTDHPDLWSPVMVRGG